MSEYIIELPDKPAKVVRDGWNVRIEWNFKQREEIVRCIDCRYYGYYDGSTWCSRTYEQVPGGTCDYQTVEPDGFCAWGERRES